MKKIKTKYLLLSILVLALAFRIILVFITPPFNASDEMANFNYQKAVCKLQFPILPVDHSWAVKYSHYEYIHGPILYLSAYPLCALQHLSDKNFLLFLRIYNVVFAIITVYLIYLIGALIFSKRLEIAISATAFAAFFPAFANKGATFNVDTISYFLITLTLYFLIKWLIIKPVLNFRHYLALAILLAINILTKSYGVYLIPLYLLFALFYNAKNWKVWAGVGLAILVGLIAVLPWLYWRNYLHYGDLLAIGIDWGRPTGTYIKKLTDTWNYFCVSFWAIFSFNNGLRVNSTLNNILWWILAVITAGFIKFFITFKDKTLKKGYYLLFLMMALSLYGTYHWGMINNQSQARYFFPAIAGLSLVFAAGWQEFFPTKFKTYASYILILAFLILDIGILIWLHTAFSTYPATGPWMQTAPLP